MARQVPQAVRLLLGQVFGKTAKQTANVRVSHLELDEFVLRYYKTPKELLVHDPKEETESGDIVLIKELPVPRAHEVNHILENIVYKIGRTIDPVTGRRCTHFSYLDEEQVNASEEQLEQDVNLHEQKGNTINEGTPV
ncbi:small ribosomal subunit protein uS17m-like [Glandiceps talaboti]